MVRGWGTVKSIINLSGFCKDAQKGSDTIDQRKIHGQTEEWGSHSAEEKGENECDFTHD